MANYLPVLLVSVSAGMPDDASFQPLPRGQVDYLSHDWNEEDVWRSWRNMTKQKNEIANGVRLENASWRTWWKQRNKLKTISPETLNWLKDSDVTWLYGPLHTAVDWAPPPRSAISPPASASQPASCVHPENAAAAAASDVTGSSYSSSSSSDKGKAPANSISSPSSSVALDMYPAAHGYGYQGSFQQPGQGTGMKPILKHRTISEMLTSTLPPSPLFDTLALREDERISHSHEEHSSDEPRGRSAAPTAGRPPLIHTKSDTNILRRFDKKLSPPRVAQAASASSTTSTTSTSTNVSLGIGLDDDYRRGRITSDKRSSASGNLVGLPDSSTSYSRSRSGSRSRYQQAHGARSGSSDTTSSTRSDYAGLGSSGVGGGGSGATYGGHQIHQQPQKKHISFNAIVIQCIAIEGEEADNDGTAAGSLSNSRREPALVGRYDDGYVDDEEDELYEEVHTYSDSDDREEEEEEEEDDEVIEIKTPSRRSSESSITGIRPTIEVPSQQHSFSAAQLSERLSSPTLKRNDSHDSTSGPTRPHFRRTSTSKSARSLRSNGSGSGSTSGSNANGVIGSSGNRSSEREHVTIAPIAPTILKAGGSSESGDDGSPTMYLPAFMASSTASDSPSSPRLPGQPYSSARVYDYEDYEPRDYESYEGGEVVYQSPNGRIYPWLDQNSGAGRQRSPVQHGSPSSPTIRSPRIPSPRLQPPSRSPSSPRIAQRQDYQAHGLVSSASQDEGAEEDAFEYFDGPDVNEDYLVRERVIVQQQEPRPGRKRSPTLERVDANILRNANGAGDNADRRSSTTTTTRRAANRSNSMVVPVSDTVRERTPSPDAAPLCNPRVASLKSEAYYGSSSSSDRSNAPGGNNIGPTAPPTLAIPTPGISPTHVQSDLLYRSPPDSPTVNSELPHEMSPSRGRMMCASPTSVSDYVTSGSATSSSGVLSRSGSGSRSDSRGRGRTRTAGSSSLSPSDVEPERGRSRSRSSASGANSPLSDSASPNARRGPSFVGPGYGHSGREIKDGRGVRLYRKTSEDFLGRNDSRGRDRESRRISESLSPPVVSSASNTSSSLPTGARASASPPGTHGAYTSSPLYRSYSAQEVDNRARLEADSNHADRTIGGSNGSPASSLRNVPPPGLRLVSSNGGLNVITPSSSGSSMYSNVERTLPPSIPEQDEQKPNQGSPSAEMRLVTPSVSTSAQTPHSPSSRILADMPITQEEPTSFQHPFPIGSISSTRDKAISNSEYVAHHTRSPSFADSEGSSSGLVSKAAELVSSARGLLGAIWNGA